MVTYNITLCVCVFVCVCPKFFFFPCVQTEVVVTNGVIEISGQDNIASLCFVFMDQLPFPRGWAMVTDSRNPSLDRSQHGHKVVRIWNL